MVAKNKQNSTLKTTTLRIFTTESPLSSIRKEVGYIIFDTNAKKQLILSTSNKEQAHKLSEVWKKILTEPYLGLSKEFRQDGMKAFGHQQIKPDSPEFRWAIYDTLERTYGYMVEVE